MRSVELGKVAAQAEALRIKRLASRTGTRAAMGVVALVFVILLLVMLHIAAATALEPYVGPVYAPLIVAAVDLIVAAILGTLAAVSKPGRIEREAYEVRETARLQMMQALAIGSIAGELFRNIGLRKMVELAVVVMSRRRRGVGRR